MPPRSTTTTPASANSDPTLRPFLGPASASGVGSSVGSVSSNGGCDTGIGLTLTVDRTGSGPVDVVSLGVSSGSGVRSIDDSDGEGSSVGDAVGVGLRDGLGPGVSVGHTMVPQVGRGVGERVGEGASVGWADSLGDGSFDDVGDGDSWTRSSPLRPLDGGPPTPADVAAAAPVASRHPIGTAASARRTPTPLPAAPTASS